MDSKHKNLANLGLNFDWTGLWSGMFNWLRLWLASRLDKLIVLSLSALSAVLHFWRLKIPDKFVFDEVYFPVYANNYLEGTRFFDSHPPLGKYLIALGIRFFGFNPLGYRVMDALAGILVIVLMYKLGKILFNRNVGFLAAFFACLDGLLLVESRAGLINIFAVVFSLAAYTLFFKSGAEQTEKPRWVYLAGAGICIGAAAAVKWIGVAGFGIIVVFYGLARLNRRWFWPNRLIARTALTNKIAMFHPGLIFICFVLLPVVIYSSTFIYHLNRVPDYDFIELHKQMFGYHAHLQEGHGYASSWWSWPLLLRPVSYFWQIDQSTQIVQTILNLGNPILWWLALPATLFGLWAALFRHNLGAQFALLAIAMHYLPFALISRATFLYHFMGALPFTILLTAYAIHELWSAQGWKKEVAAASVVAIILAAIYFFPLWTAYPIPKGAFYQRMWLLGWI